MNEFDEQIKTSKTIPFDKKHILVEKDTFDTMHKVINESKKVYELQLKINEVFKEINNYREIKSLKTKNSNLLQENNKLRAYIDTILEIIKKFFRKLLQILK